MTLLDLIIIIIFKVIAFYLTTLFLWLSGRALC